MKHIIITIIILSLSSIAAGAPGDKARKRVISDLNSAQKMANRMHGSTNNDCYSNIRPSRNTIRSMKYKVDRAISTYAANCSFSRKFFQQSTKALDDIENRACTPIGCDGHRLGYCHGEVAGGIKDRIRRARNAVYSCQRDHDPRTGRRIK